jgi:hypothetical protein
VRLDLPAVVPPLAFLAPAAALLLRCGGSPPPKTPQAEATAPAPAEVSAAEGPPKIHSDSSASVGSAANDAAHLPTACARDASGSAGASSKSGELCTPPGAFIERLCARPHQEVALALFAKASPFTRLYLKARLDELAFDEEVLALRFHEQPKGGMVVGSGNGTYDVLRWDGSCSMGVEAEVFTRSRPPRPRAAHVQWHRVGERMQSALIASSDGVKRAHAKRGKECKGAMSGDVSAACEKADAALVEAIVECVRETSELPAPEGL